MTDIVEPAPPVVPTEPALPPLPRPVYFVLKTAGATERWADLLSDVRPVPPALHDQHWRVITNEDMFTVQTYVQLRRRGLDVRLVTDFPRGEICVVSGLDIRAAHRPYGSFVVGIRGDGHRPSLCDVIVAHNTEILEPGDVWFPTWLQTGLIPRDPSRGDRIEHMEFKGDSDNLHAWFKDNAFRAELAQLGVSFDIADYDKSPTNRWHDYRETDLLLAVRDLPVRDSDVKPPVKLLNAWAGGSPALLGPESGYRQLRRSPLDYLEVRTPEQVGNAVTLLKDQPRLYRAMIENGARRVEAFSDEATAQRWRDFLAGEVYHRFQKWSSSPRSVHVASFPFRVLDQRRQKAVSARRRTTGARLLTGDGRPIPPLDGKPMQ
jgi:hypothetical protein